LLILGLLTVVHLTVGWLTLLAPWSEIQPRILIAGLGLVLVSYAIRSIRIQAYFRPATSGHFPSVFRLVLVHNLLNNLLPMRTGEASFPVLMASRFGIPYSRSIPALIYLRALDLHFVLLLGGLVLLLDRTRFAWLLLLLLVPVPYGFFRMQEIFDRRLAGRNGKVRGLGRKILQGLPSSAGLFWTTWLWTTVNWSVKLLVLAWVLRAFTPMPFPVALVGTTTGELSSVLPFHGIAGAGTYEAGILAGLVPLGIELEKALKGAVNLHLFVLGVSILVGILAALVPAGRNGTDEAPVQS
jgi:uncharacterized membrane protein YbhN (UPF0104 family)